MKKLKYLPLVLLALASLACSLSIRVPVQEESVLQIKEEVLLTIAYETTQDETEINLAFFAERPTTGSSVSIYSNGRFLGLTEVSQMYSDSPVSGFAVTARYESGQLIQQGTTDSNGHLSLTLPVGGEGIVMNLGGDDWSCDQIAVSDNEDETMGISVFTCRLYQPTG